MKKIVFITVHVGSNFGSVLQTFATYYILTNMGYDVSVLNYIPPRVTIEGFFRNRKGICRKLRALIGLPIVLLNKRIYGGFIDKYCKLTKPYYNIKTIKEEIPEADIYITGSDQVWNSSHNEGIDEMYYFTFLPKGSRVISLASSFGKELLEKEEVAIIKGFLDNYRYLSVREESGRRILNSLGFNDVIHLIDPTFLLSKEIWKKILVKRQLINYPYLLLYLPYNIVSKDIIYASARRIADRYNLKLVTFSCDVRKEKQADKTLFFTSPSEFLALMFYADYVITNSFHGTAFSINLNKQFFVYQPSAFSTRISDILYLMGLEKRYVTGTVPIDELCETIDYSSVNKILEEERKKVEKYLCRALK